MPTKLILGNLWTSLAHVFRFRIRSRRYLGKNACWCSPQKLMDSEFPVIWKSAPHRVQCCTSTQVAITSSAPLQWISSWVVLLASPITWFQWAERQMTRTSPMVLVETSVETRKKHEPTRTDASWHVITSVWLSDCTRRIDAAAHKGIGIAWPTSPSTTNLGNGSVELLLRQRNLWLQLFLAWRLQWSKVVPSL